MPPRKRCWLWAAGLLALGLALRLFRLTHECLWLDECLTLDTAREPGLAAMLAHIHASDPHPPLYFIVMHYWIKLFGSSAVALRLVSVLCSAAGPLLMVGIARHCGLRSRTWPWLVGLICAIQPMQIYYAQETRSYALLALLELLACYAVLRAFPKDSAERTRWGWLTLGLGIGAGALWVHYFALFVNLAIWLTAGMHWIANRQRDSARRTLLLVIGTCLLAAWPLLQMVRNFLSGKGIEWLPTSYDQWLVLDVLRTQWFAPLRWPYPFGWLIVGIAVGCLLTVLGLLRARKAMHPPARNLLFAGMGCTLVLPITVSLFKPIIFGGERYLIIAQPFLILALTLGFAGARRRVLRGFVGIGLLYIVALQTAYLVDFYRYRHKRLYDQVWREITPSPDTSTTVYTYPQYHRLGLEYYAPAGSRVIGLTDLAQLHARTSTQPDWFVCPRLDTDPRITLDQLGLSWNGPMRVLETHMPGNELYLLQLSPGRPQH